jgi:hypothetical protein
MKQKFSFLKQISYQYIYRYGNKVQTKKGIVKHFTTSIQQ